MAISLAMLHNQRENSELGRLVYSKTQASFYKCVDIYSVTNAYRDTIAAKEKSEKTSPSATVQPLMPGSGWVERGMLGVGEERKRPHQEEELSLFYLYVHF